MLALFYDKKCCNYINFVPCILWDFIVLGLVLSCRALRRIGAVSQLAHEKSNPRKGHVRSTCWKLKSHAKLSVS